MNRIEWPNCRGGRWVVQAKSSTIRNVLEAQASVTR